MTSPAPTLIESVATLLAGGALSYGLGYLLIRIIQRKHRASRSVGHRSGRHEAWVTMLLEWTDDPRVMKLITDRKVVSPDGIKRARAVVGKVGEENAKKLCAALVQDRVVRRAIADVIVRRHGTPHQQAMKALLRLKAKHA